MSTPYFGPYRGLVVNNEDPLGRMRVQVLVPGVLGEQVSSWALSCVPPGSTSIPEVGARVWVEFEGGDPSYPVWMGTMGPAGTDQDG